MKQRKNLAKFATFIRNALIVLGSLLILVALMLLIFYFVFNPTLKGKNDSSNMDPMWPTHKVLYLDSFSTTYPSYNLQEAGLKEGLYTNNISYDVVYMDTKNYGTEEEISQFYQFFKERLLNSNKKYDGLIAGDDAALKFALEYQDELFPGLPIVFFGVKNIELAEEASNNPLITGFIEETYLNDTFDLAGQLLPQATKITAIYDNTAIGQEEQENFFSFRSNYPEYEFSGINTSELTQRNFIETLESLSGDVILVYLSAFEDADSNNYSIQESLRTILEHTHIPVFSNYSEGQGNGILGGTEMNYTEQCRMTGELMSEILNGKNISEIPLNKDTPGIIKYDYNMMKKFNLDVGLLPEETILLNQPINVFKEYKEVLLPIALTIIGLVIILAGFVINYALLKAVEHQLEYDANYDILLEIPNRQAAERYLAKQLEKHLPLAIVRMDLDHFKSLNETYGHQIGDDYLRHCANLFKKYAETNSFFISRYSGDEFIMFVNRHIYSEYDDAVLGIHKLFHNAMTVGMEEVRATISIGVANSETDSTVSSLFLNADIAITHAKENGRNCTILFTEEIERHVAMVNNTRAKIIDAIESDGFYMLYQPKIETDTKKLVGFEALIRMKNETLSPGIFVPIAEQSGFITQIGRMTTEYTIKQLAQWRDQGIELKPISINYSRNQLNDTGYVNFLRTMLKKYDVDPKYVEIEITEGLFMETSRQVDNLFVQFQALGVKILMDDFGTGYSSLGYLTYIPVDILKLDKSLVDTYLVEGKESIIKDIVNLTHDFGKKLIIEGVEEEWQYEKLKEFGADVIQGYYFSKPLPPELAYKWHAE
ncbi:MAG: EAL domain-containing protein [Treponema sp.]|nr:EAL domain-containing protein [Treponema sp.]